MEYNYINIKTKKEHRVKYPGDVPCPTCGKMCGAGVEMNVPEKVGGLFSRSVWVKYYKYECNDVWEDGCGTTWDVKELG